MTTFSFSKLIPGGNPTILLTDPECAVGELAGIASRLMSPMHLQAEQVGALYSAGSGVPGALPHCPHLRMMGGEFCVNATRSAAMLLALQDAPGAALWQGELTVSGMDVPVRVLVSPGMEGLSEAIGASDQGKPHAGACPDAPARSLRYCAARAPCADSACREMEEGLTLVTLPGIAHVLADTVRHPLPDMLSPAWKIASSALRSACGLSEAPASGVVWYERLGAAEYRIWPAVEVRATASEYLESACGSACLALSLALCANGREKDGSITVIQPSGERLRVISPAGPASTRQSWIAGPVLLAAEGLAYL